MAKAGDPSLPRAQNEARISPELEPVWSKLAELLDDVFWHSGFGEIRIAVRWLNKGRKEVIVSCGKEYRFVVEAKSLRASRPDLGPGGAPKGTL